MGTCLLVLDQHRLRIFKWEADKNLSSTLSPISLRTMASWWCRCIIFWPPLSQDSHVKVQIRGFVLTHFHDNKLPLFLPGLHHMSGKGSKHPCTSPPRVGACANRKSVWLINFYQEPERTRQERTGLGWHFLPGYSITFNSSPKHKSKYNLF